MFDQRFGVGELGDDFLKCVAWKRLVEVVHQLVAPFSGNLISKDHSLEVRSTRCGSQAGTYMTKSVVG